MTISDSRISPQKILSNSNFFEFQTFNYIHQNYLLIQFDVKIFVLQCNLAVLTQVHKLKVETTYQ